MSPKTALNHVVAALANEDDSDEAIHARLATVIKLLEVMVREIHGFHPAMGILLLRGLTPIVARIAERTATPG